MNGTISNSDFLISLVTRDGGNQTLNWTVLETTLPSNFIYIYLDLNATIEASAYYDNVIESLVLTLLVDNLLVYQ